MLRAAIRLVDDHTFVLSDERDPKVVFLTEAYDISVREGRVYSGVGPGATVLAAPFYAALKPVLSRFDDRVVANRRFRNYYLRNAATLPGAGPRHLADVYLLQILLAALLVAPLSASFGARLVGFLTAHGVERAPATAAAVATGLGSMVLYYSAMYSRQALAYGLAWHAILWLAESGGPRRRACLLGGALLGAAVAIDYPSAILVALSLLFLLPRLGAPARLLVMLPLLALLALLAAYHQAAFGSPFATPYHFRFWITPEPLARQGLDLAAFQEGAAVGLNAPSPAVMARLCFGRFKGLFLYSPVLLLGLAGNLKGLRAAGHRSVHLFCLAVFASYLVFNSMLGTHVPGFGRYFWGGLSVLWGPRYLYAVVPFLAIGLVEFDWRRRAARLLAWALLLVSCAVNVAGTMFSDVVMSTYAFGPELRFPLAYVTRLLVSGGPRVPLLDVYGVSRGVQDAGLLALSGVSLLLLRLSARAPRGDRSSTDRRP
ncbi:MAG: hypothetical protein DMF81_15495 [Acidobacteria bacterium]|nr:MAG: hypothetical protein DMF81_15495 [Acidobacteriota bacterium]